MPEITQNLPTLAEIRAIPEFKPLKPKQKRFLIAYCRIGQIAKSATMAHLSWLTHYRWMDTTPEYKQAFDKAREIFADYAEGDIFNRAFIGEDKGIYRNGECIDTIKQKSDILAMFALKGMRPQYRDNWQSSNVVGPIAVSITYPNQVNVTENSISKLVDEPESPLKINPPHNK